ncbi:MAG: hypothetical protein AUK55_05020 [Syntrophobacteraceae bacterium CG2_30_61_12]|nr:MAG: hypothetical protein AUK55_05020 [Syntrophobacteraceae bacterium CG2_30_61_12]
MIKSASGAPASDDEEALQFPSTLQDSLPYPIAHLLKCYNDNQQGMLGEASVLAGLLFLSNIHEFVLKYLALVMFSALLQTDLHFTNKTAQEIIKNIIRPSLGNWAGLTQSVSDCCQKQKNVLSDDIVEMARWADGMNTSFFGFIQGRNEMIGHVYVPAAIMGYRDTLRDWHKRMQGILEALEKTAFSRLPLVSLGATPATAYLFRGSQYASTPMVNHQVDLIEGNGVVFVQTNRGMLRLSPFVKRGLTSNNLPTLYFYDKWMNYKPARDIRTVREFELVKGESAVDEEVLALLEKRLGLENLKRAYESHQTEQYKDPHGYAIIKHIRSHSDIMERPELAKVIETFVAQTKGGYLLLTAPSGMGKTAFLCWYCAARMGRIGYFFNKDRTTPRNCFNYLYKSLARNYSFHKSAEDIDRANNEEFRDAFLALLDTVSRQLKEPEVVVIDALDQSESVAEVLSFLPKDEMPKSIYFMLSAKKLSDPLRNFQAEINGEIGYQQVDFMDRMDENKETVAKLLRTHLLDLSATGAIELARKLEANFLVAKHMLEEVGERESDPNERARRFIDWVGGLEQQPLPQKLIAIYGSAFERIGKGVQDDQHKYNDFINICALLCVAREPLSLLRISDFLNISTPNVQIAMNTLMPFLVSSNQEPTNLEHGVETHGFYHFTFVKFLRDKEPVRTVIQQGTPHHGIVTHYAKRPCASWDSYGLLHAASHALLKAETLEDQPAQRAELLKLAFAWLTDPDCLHRNHHRHGFTGITTAFEVALRHPWPAETSTAIQHLFDTIRHEDGFLGQHREDPDFFKSQIYNCFCALGTAPWPGICNRWRNKMQGMWLQRDPHCPHPLWSQGEAIGAASMDQYDRAVREIRFDTDGDRAVSISDGETALLWDLFAGSSSPLQDGSENRAVKYSFMAGNETCLLLAVEKPDAKIELHRTSCLEAELIGLLELWPEDDESDAYRTVDEMVLTNFAVSPWGATIAMVIEEQDGEVEPQRAILIWNAVTGDLRGRLPGAGVAGDCLAFSQDERQLAADAENGEVLLWDLSLFGEPHRLAAQGNSVASICFLPRLEPADPFALVVGYDNGAVFCWRNARTPMMFLPASPDQEGWVQVACSTSGRLVCGYGHHLDLLDANAGHLLARSMVGDGVISAVAISANGCRIGAGLRNGQMIWYQVMAANP